MPPPTSSLKPGVTKANGANGASGKKASPSATPAAVPASASEDKSSSAAGTAGRSKPDKTTYDAEQESLNKEIAAVKAKLDAVRSRIALSQAPKGEDRRSQIKAELDGLRAEQGKFKTDRSKTFEEMKKLQTGVAAKIKDIQAQRGKIGFKSTGEIDQRIEQIETGTMKLVDEKKALSEITTLRRTRKQLEATGSADDSIAADKARIDELKKILDDPEAKRVGDRFDELKKEMDGLREEGNKAFEERGKLFDERNALSAQMDDLYAKKRDSAQKYREDNDRYYAKMQADRQARHERFKAEKAKEDAARRDEEIIRLREEAKLAAYGSEIEDCRILIGWFQGKYGGGEIPNTNAGGKGQVSLEGVKALEIRQVENDFKGMTLKKKDDEDMGGFFGGGGGKKKGGAGKGKKGGNSAAASGTATPSEGAASAGGASAGAVNLPMSLLSALLSLGIPPPSGKEDVQRVIDDLETKKAWFEANSEAKTKTEMERVEKLVAKMQKKNALLAEGDDEVEDEVEEKASGGVKEPTHTVAPVAGSVAGKAEGGDHAEDSPSEEVKHVDSALEEIKEAAQ